MAAFPTKTPHEARRMALVRIHQALDCDRYGMVRTSNLSDAADYFRMAGMPDYAERCDNAASELTDHDVLTIQSELDLHATMATVAVDLIYTRAQ